MTSPILAGKEAADHLKNLEDPTAYRCTNPTCICRVTDPPVQVLTRTTEMATFYRLTLNYGHGIHLFQHIAANSSEAMDVLLTWANEFNTIHAATKWGAEDGLNYMDAIDQFYADKRGAL